MYKSFKQNKLEKINLMLKAIVESSDDAIIGKTLDGIIAIWNPAAERMYGYKAEEVMGKPISILLSPERKGEIKKVLEKLRKGERIEHFETTHLRKNGKEIAVSVTISPIKDAKGKIIGACSIARDVTEKKEMEKELKRYTKHLQEMMSEQTKELIEANESLLNEIKERKKVEKSLRKSEKRFRDISFSMADWIWEVDKEGRYIFVSEKVKSILGYEAEELIGKRPFELMPKEEAKRIKKIFKNIASKKKPIVDLENCYLTKDGKKVCILSNGVPILNKKGELKGYRGVDKDITLRKRREMNLRNLNRALKTLTKCNSVLIRAENEKSLLKDICRLIVEEGEYHFAWVGFLKRDREKTVRPVAYAGHEDGYLSTVHISWAENKEGKGPTGRAIRTGKVQITQDIRTDREWGAEREEALKRGYASTLTFPLLAQGKAFGVLKIYSSEPNAFDPEEVTLLSELADDLSYGIQSLRIKAAHKKSVETLKKKRLVLSEAERIAHLGSWEWDIIKNRVHFSDEIHSILGFKPAELKQTFDAFLERVHLHDREIVKKTVEKALEEKTSEIEYRILRRDGTERIVRSQVKVISNKSGKPIKMFGTLQDITELKKIEEDIIKLSNAVEQTVDIVFITNKDGIIEYVNPSFEKITGYSRDEAIGKKPSILKSGLMSQEYYRKVWSTITSGKAIRAVVTNRKKNGELFFYDQTITPIKDPQGNITHFVSTGRDITEIKKVEEKKKELEKMKSDFIILLAHEIGTPLTIITGWTDVLKIILKQHGVEKNEAFEHMERNLERIKKLKEAMTNLVLIEQEKFPLMKEPIFLHPIAKNVVNEFKIFAEKKQIEMIFTMPPMCKVLADRDKIHHLVSILVENAIRYTPEGGQIEISGKEGKDFVEVMIKDNGIGIGEEEQEKIFDLFYQVKDISIHKEGLGLGLSVAKGIVEAHGGKIWVDSEVGVGSVFHFTLPKIKKFLD